jgi:monoamine oxidase
MTQRHTVIVGGGLAGLWIADALAKRGDAVTVLEKYDYLGGRVLTAKAGYEIGAGRVHDSHRLVADLVRRYKLHTTALRSESLWRPLGASSSESNEFDAAWASILPMLEALPSSILATHTLAQLAVRVMGPSAMQLLDKFPYRAETERMRADLGIHSFMNEMGYGDAGGYYVVNEGLSAIVRGLEADILKRGGRIVLNTEIVDVKGTTVVAKGGRVFEGDRVILALHASALRRLPATRHLTALKHLTMAPLTRIYASYPSLGWLGSTRIVTDSPLRYIIPVNPAAGIVMISYVDDRDTRRWKGLTGARLQREIQKELRRLFHREIPEPRWVKAYEWTDGCTYWMPGAYDPATEARAAMAPRPGLYICGESLSVGRQAWMEGALETAADVLRTLTH